MAKNFFKLMLLSLVSLTIISCHKKSDTPSPQDNIQIVSVTPSSGLVNGQATNFVVAVSYTLASTSQGELNIGFNTMSTSEYILVSNATTIVQSGSSTHTFNVTVSPVNWGSSPFGVYVNLSPNPHGSMWTPLAGAIKNLSF